MRRLLATFILLAAGLSVSPDYAWAAEPRLLASGAVEAVLIDAGRRLLYSDEEQRFWRIDLPDGTPQPWEIVWDPASAGFGTPEDMLHYNNLTASPDGSRVVLVRVVEFPNPDPDYDYPFTAALLLSCPAEGGAATPISLADLSDGGPQFSFSMDGRYLIGPWFYDCAPDATSAGAWLNTLFNRTDEDWPLEPPNAYDFALDRLVHLPGLELSDWGVEQSPFSDWYYYEGMDEPELVFGRLDAAAGSQFTLPYPDSLEGWFGLPIWTGPETLLSIGGSKQIAAAVDGRSSELPGSDWLFYCRLPEGRSFFSRDGGASIELGQVDWLSLSVNDVLAQPQLAQFALPVDESGWPERMDTWLPLPSGSGVVIHTPGMDGGGLYFISLD